MTRMMWCVPALLLAALPGCSKSDFKVAKVTGQVTCDGKPVPYVSVYFQPKRTDDRKSLVGKQGVGYANEKGEFTISTYDSNDGAVIGPHGVLVGSPVGDVPAGFKCDCLLSTKSTDPVTEVKVEPGKPNTFVIQLKAGNRIELAKQEKAMVAEQKRNRND